MLPPVAAQNSFAATANQGFSASFSYHRLEVNGQVVSQGQSGSFNPWSMGDQFQAAAAGRGPSAVQHSAGENPLGTQSHALAPNAQGGHLPQGPLMQGLLRQIGQLTQVLQSLVQMLSGLLPQAQNATAAPLANAQAATTQPNAAATPAIPG